MEFEQPKRKACFFIIEKSSNGKTMILAYDSHKRLIPLSEKKNLADAMLAITNKHPNTLFINMFRSTNDIKKVFFAGSSLDLDPDICFITNKSDL